MAHNDRPGYMVSNKEQWFRKMHGLVWGILLGLDFSFYTQTCPERSVSCCACETLQLWCLRKAGCLLTFPRVYSLEKTPAAQLDSVPGRKQHYIPPSSGVQLEGCSPCILTDIRNAILPHPDISCAKGCLPIPHSYQVKARQILALYDKAQCFTSDIST